MLGEIFPTPKEEDILDQMKFHLRAYREGRGEKFLFRALKHAERMTEPRYDLFTREERETLLAGILQWDETVSGLAGETFSTYVGMVEGIEEEPAGQQSWAVACDWLEEKGLGGEPLKTARRILAAK